MKLTYRGHAYEVPAPQPVSTSADQSKLIYRGQIYYVTPRSIAVPEAIEPDRATVTLIYRGNIYKRKLQFLQPHQQLRVIN